MRAYWQDEFASTSVNAISQLAEVAKPSLYRDFGSEDGLTCAALTLYASVVLARVEALLSSDASFTAKIESLIAFASDDPSLETGCLFVKMRARRSRYGVQTQEKLAEIETQLLETYVRFFREARARGEWQSAMADELAARYLIEQLGLAITQRATGSDSQTVRALFNLALSALLRA